MPTPARLTNSAFLGFIDSAYRKSSVSFDVSAADVTAWAADVTVGNIKTLFDAIEALSLDNPTLKRASKNYDEIGLLTVAPTDNNAVNSAKIIALIQDATTGSKFSMQIPARKASAYTQSRGLIDITVSPTTEVSNYIDAVALTMLSEDGNAVRVYEMRVIGKGTAA